MSSKVNPGFLSLIKNLYAASETRSENIWRDLAKRLEKPRRSWPEVNLSQLSRVTSKGEVIVVPGKLLGSGNQKHAVDVYCVFASESAREKVKAAGGKVHSLSDFLNIKSVKGVKIIK